MGLFVFFLVPETKGRTLEGMDEVFGSAYGDAIENETGAGAMESVRLDEGGLNSMHSQIRRKEGAGDEITKVATHQQAVPMASL